MPEYQYDVALSFLAQDEPLATQLANILEERHRVFLYSRKQEQLAGTDGEKTFNDVFAKKARVVVVLYRQGWGESPWTRIEETAIRNRAYDEGYEFALFVPTDDRPTVPNYVPKTRLWIGIGRFGLNGTASVIDARVQELGGEPRILSLEDRAARALKASEFKAFRQGYFRSYEAVQAADASFARVVETMEQRVAKLQVAAPGLSLQAKRFEKILVVLGTELALRLEWQRQFANDLEGAYMDASVWEGHPPVPGALTFSKEHHPKHKLRVTPDVTEARTFAWHFKGQDAPALLDADAACEQILSWWMANTERAAV
jgi:hypothetical protein